VDVTDDGGIVCDEGGVGDQGGVVGVGEYWHSASLGIPGTVSLARVS
jgi:hypothetical protein